LLLPERKISFDFRRHAVWPHHALHGVGIKRRPDRFHRDITGVAPSTKSKIRTHPLRSNLNGLGKIQIEDQS
jgi:hypothetical protein